MVHSSCQLTGIGSSRLSTPVKPPRFFKIIDSSSFIHKKLKLPTKFVREYGEDLGSRVLLKVPSGTVWEVDVVKSNNEAYLCKGWEEFTKYYSMCLWHFLVFKYEGKSSFHVIILDRSASEIEYPFNLTRGNQIDKRSSINLIPNKEARVARAFSKNYVKMSGNKGSKPLEMARAFKSKNPFFIANMQKSYVSGSSGLYIPMDFAKYIQDKDKVELQVSKGRVWSAKCYWSLERTRCYIYFVTFASDNNIQVGDVCAFELVDPVKALMNVVKFH